MKQQLLSETYRRLFKARTSSNDKTLIETSLNEDRYANTNWKAKHLVSIQVGQDRDGFDIPEKLMLPTVIKNAVGEYTPPKSDSETAHEKALDRYIAKIEKALLKVGEKVVPGMKLYFAEDGFITFELPMKPDAQTKAKLNTLYKGAKSIEF
jgi:hypothetical protein